MIPEKLGDPAFWRGIQYPPVSAERIAEMCADATVRRLNEGMAMGPCGGTTKTVTELEEDFWRGMHWTREQIAEMRAQDTRPALTINRIGPALEIRNPNRDWWSRRINDTHEHWRTLNAE